MNIVLDCRSTFFENAAGQRDSGRVTGRILIHIIIVVEMRNACPFQINFLVDDNIISKVLMIQLVIQGIEGFRCQAFTALVAAVDFQFELCKHGLTIQRCAELLQEIVDEIRTALFVLGCLE